MGSETIRYGQRVTVIALPSLPPVFLSPKRPASVPARAFGYDLEFKSVFAQEPARSHIDDIRSLALGAAWIPWARGGGRVAIPYLPLLNMRATIRRYIGIQLLDAADLADDDWVGTVAANMGAPLSRAGAADRQPDPGTRSLGDGEPYRQALCRR